MAVATKTTIETYDQAAAEIKRSVIDWHSTHQFFGLPVQLFDGRGYPCPVCKGDNRFGVFDDYRSTGGIRCRQCFKTKNSDGISAVAWWLRIKNSDAIVKLCEYLHIDFKPPHRKPFIIEEPWSDILAQLFCLTERGRGITLDALKSCHCVQGTHYDYHVIGPEVFGESGEVVGHSAFNITGGTLPVFHKDKGKPPDFKKVKTSHGCPPGWIGQVDKIESAEVIWKVEGPKDCLALAAVIPPGTPHAVISNAHGAMENLQLWMVEKLRGKIVRVVGDADKAGQAGAEKSGAAILIQGGAALVVLTRLPYLVKESHGEDLRDYLTTGGGTWESLQQLGNNPAFTKQMVPDECEAILEKYAKEILEAPDDPHRLARLNLDTYERAFPGAKIRYWKEQFYTWKPSRPFYRQISEAELKSKLTAVIRSDFVRLNQEQLKKYREWKKSEGFAPHKDKGPPEVKKVSGLIVSNTMAAMASMCLIPDSTEINTYVELDEKTNTPIHRSRRKWIGLQNYVLDITAFLAGADEDKCLLDPTPNWFSQICLPVEFSKTATCPKFERFLETSLEMDPERIKILQEWAGYCLTHDLSQAKFLILEGGGSNGKTVYLSALEALLGKPSVSHISLENFSQRFGLVPTIGKLANICGDAGEIDRMAEGLLKAFTDGNPMTIDRKNLSAIEVTPTAKLVLACNNKPRFSDRSEGIWRRMILIPFTREIPEADRIVGMSTVEYWQESGELPGILLWALRGLARFKAQGKFTRSAESDKATNEYRSENNPARAFLKENMESDTESVLKSSHIYGMYSHWCKSSGYRALSEAVFFKEVKRVFPGTERKNGSESGKRLYVYTGIKFSSEEISGISTSQYDWPPKNNERRIF